VLCSAVSLREAVNLGAHAGVNRVTDEGASPGRGGDLTSREPLDVKADFLLLFSGASRKGWMIRPLSPVLVLKYPSDNAEELRSIDLAPELARYPPSQTAIADLRV
jgi:hypothetical protein